MPHMRHLLIFLPIVLSLISGTMTNTATKSKKPSWPPVVNLGDGQVHKSLNNGTGSLSYYSFEGIRYGHVLSRFSAPAPLCIKTNKSCLKKISVKGSKSSLSDDQVKTFSKCPQANPNWIAENAHVLGHVFSTNKSSVNTFLYQNMTKSEPIKVPKEEKEDCLFLDVIVPRQVWEKTQTNPNLGFVPVIVWIHDGGFTAGDKRLRQDPTDLLRNSFEYDKQGVILVSINYRLGLFGFLSGDSHLVSNVGLLDQRMALGWVQKHIQKFGGDKFRVTVIGEGAGAGAIMHHMTAPNITKDFFPQIHPPSSHDSRFPFRSAMLQSPTFQPLIPSQALETLARVYTVASALSGYSVDSIPKLRKLPYETLYAVNTLVVHESPHGTFTFGPTVDYSQCSYVPDFPLRRLNSGLVASGVHVLVGHLKNEGRFYIPTVTMTDIDFRTYLTQIFPTICKRDIRYIADSLYPSFDYEKTDQGVFNRNIEAIDDIFTSCNSYYLSNIIGNSYGYILDLPEVNRSSILEQIFFGGTPLPTTSESVARAFQGLQKKLIQFGMFAVQGAQTAGLRSYHRKDRIDQVLLVSYVKPQGYINDPAAKEKCRYWAEYSYEKR